MNETLLRIRKIFNDSGKSQTEIGRMIYKTSQYVWKILNNDSLKPSESTIKDICQAFNVREEWLLYGIEPIYETNVRAFIDSVYGDDIFITEIITAYMELDQESKMALRQLADKMFEQRQLQKESISQTKKHTFSDDSLLLAAHDDALTDGSAEEQEEELRKLREDAENLMKDE